MTQERFTRAQPRELKKIRLRKRPEKIVKKIVVKQKVLEILSNLNQRILIKQKKKDRKSKLINIKEIIDPACKAKKAKSRHEYFSMRKSGKGGGRSDPTSNRFTVRC